MEKISYISLKKLAKQADAFRQRFAILGDCATQQLATALTGESVRREWPLSVYDADYNQMEALLFDRASELYAFAPDYILLFFSTEKLKLRFDETAPAERTGFAQRECERICTLWQAAAAGCKAKLLVPDFPIPEDAVFGSFALRTPASFGFQIRKLNLLLSEAAAERFPIVYPVALGDLQTALGADGLFEDRSWYLAKMAVKTDALPAFVSRIMDTVTALAGKVRKCVIVDLDNTLWGGVIGDDGIDGIQLGELGDGPAFIALQRWLLELKRRGILLAVCSKNNEDTAKEPFEKHPEMVLRLEDFAAIQRAALDWMDQYVKG